MSALVQVKSLEVAYRSRGQRVRAVDGISFEIERGQLFGLIGESGSGKSSVAMALTRYASRNAEIHAERLRVAGQDLLALHGTALREYRRNDIGVVYQEPGRALNPTATVGAQIAEAHRLGGVAKSRAQKAAVRSLAEVGMPNPQAVAYRYPHELSGGQQQRAMVAMALANRPQLLILDEPTTGLDPHAQADVLSLVKRLQRELGFATLLISHDLPTVAAYCDRLAVLERGRIVDTVSSHAIAATAGFSIAPLEGLGHRAAAPHRFSRGERVLVASKVTKKFGSFVAVNDVSLHIDRGETLALVGESGCGKTTLARALAGLTTHEGSVTINAPTSPPPVQFVFQSPESSLNPRRTVAQTLGRAIELLHGDRSPEQLAASTGLSADTLAKLPHQLSGGQKQRVAIARAFAGRSSVIVCDETTSALDTRLRATILDLLIELQERTAVSYLFISHDLTAVQRIAHRVAVMQNARLVETAAASAIFERPQHPYTQRLLAAAAAARGRNTG
ncbi:ABC transporter ATP-binding protein [Microbacterium marmarense]|uniref:ABC transporter ATP-binding protein n=1 Tax=Microbacterium marmarense TaxID=3122051 RepID=A0ABU8LQM1_9MICO